VAVLDDDPDVADSIGSSFEMLGYSARPFYNTTDLLEGAAAVAFDCFVPDWVVNDGTVLEVVRSLRGADGSCPIVILTAQMSTGAINETDIADAIKRYDLLFCEKPVRTSILAAMLSRALASRSDQVGLSQRR
jgi:FixJ family two-component response regulator